MNIVNSVALKGPSPCYEAVSEAAQDAYTRLIFPVGGTGAALYPVGERPGGRH